MPFIIKGGGGLTLWTLLLIKKRREEYIEKVFENLLSFLSIFRWVLDKKKFNRLLEGVYIVFGYVKKIECRSHQ